MEKLVGVKKIIGNNRIKKKYLVIIDTSLLNKKTNNKYMHKIKITDITIPKKDQKKSNVDTTEVSHEIKFNIMNTEKTDDKDTNTLLDKFFPFIYTNTPTSMLIMATGIWV